MRWHGRTGSKSAPAVVLSILIVAASYVPADEPSTTFSGTSTTGQGNGAQIQILEKRISTGGTSEAELTVSHPLPIGTMPVTQSSPIPFRNTTETFQQSISHLPNSLDLPRQLPTSPAVPDDTVVDSEAETSANPFDYRAIKPAAYRSWIYKFKFTL